MTQKINDENGIEWEGDHQETEAIPLHNEGSGVPIILRSFEYELPPGVDMPGNQDLIEAHKSRITAFLWKDELVPVQDFKVVRAKDQRHFRIFVTCQGKPGSVILEKPQLIQDIIRPK